MKKSFKRIMLLLLVAALATQSLVSCSGDNSTTLGTEEASDTNEGVSTTESTETVEEEQRMWLDNLPENLNFDDTDILIHTRYDGSDTAAAYLEVDSQEISGDVLNDAYYTRNRKIESRLGVKISAYKGSGWQEYGSEMQRVRTSIAAADNAWQLISGWSAEISMLALDNCFLDLLEFDYLETEQPWWNQSAVNGMNINDSLYFLTGDINILTLLGGSFVLFSNDQMVYDNHLEDPAQLVLDGKWTIDKMATMVEAVANDINGNGVFDETDRLGFVTTLYNPADMFYTGADVHQLFIEDGEFVYIPAQEKVSALYDKIYPFFYGGISAGSFYLDDQTKMAEIFTSGNALMTCLSVDSSRSTLREMDDDYTILPAPKFDETQDKYYTSAFNGVCYFCIPSDNPDPEPAAAVMEAMAAYSYNTITDIYYETCLQEKYSRNQNSAKMLEIIKDGIYLDSEYLFRNILGRTCYTMRELLMPSVSGVASWYASKQVTVEAAIKEAMEKFESLN